MAQNEIFQGGRDEVTDLEALTPEEKLDIGRRLLMAVRLHTLVKIMVARLDQQYPNQPIIKGVVQCFARDSREIIKFSDLAVARYIAPAKIELNRSIDAPEQEDRLQRTFENVVASLSDLGLDQAEVKAYLDSEILTTKLIQSEIMEGRLDPELFEELMFYNKGEDDAA